MVATTGAQGRRGGNAQRFRLQRLSLRAWLMNPIRWIYPLSLRERLTYRFVAATKRWPKNAEHGCRLALAPTVLCALCKTDIAHRQIAYMGFYELALSSTFALFVSTDDPWDSALFQCARSSDGLFGS